MDVSKLNTKQFAVVFQKVLKKILEDPIENFVKARGFMNFTPSAVQEVILKIIFQKELDPYEKKLVQIEREDSEGKFYIVEAEMTETEIYKFLTDRDYDPSNIQDIQVNKINLICGRRSGKTTLAAIIALFCAITNNWKKFLSKTPFATVLIMSHSREFSDEVLDIIKQFVNESAVMKKLINKRRKQTAATLNLSMPFIEEGKIVKSQVQIKVGAASSKTTRGMAACAVICDEIAYWNLDEKMKETDVKIMKAVRPATKQFGSHAMLIKLSSPGIKQGVLYNEYEMDRKGTLPPSYAVFKAPSWMMNNIIPKEEFVEEWILDEDGFDTEYRSNFADSLSLFIMPESVDLAVQSGVKFIPPANTKDIKYFAAIDAAYKSDRFTFSLVGVTDNRVTQFVTHGWEGTRKNPVKASTVAKWVKNVLKDFPVDFVAADQFSFQPLKEIFDQHNVTLEEHTFSPSFKKKIYYNLKRLIHSQQIDLLDNDIQAKELKELVVEQSPTGTIKIGHPASGSDDFADALAVAALLATEGQSLGKFEFEALSAVKTYDIQTDTNGRTYNAAPSPDMLVMSGHLAENVVDNSAIYGIDPSDGKLKRRDAFEEEDEEDGPQFDFG